MCRKLVEQFHVCSAGNFRCLPGKTTKVIWKMKTVHVALRKLVNRWTVLS